MEHQNNKESFKLLGASQSSNDSDSEVPHFILTPPRKKLVKRRARSSSTSKRSSDSEPCHCKSRNLGLAVAVLLLLCWLVMLTWLAAVLHSELKRLDINVQAAVAGSQHIPSEIQECHSLAKDLQKNQTILFDKLSFMAEQLSSYTSKLSAVQSDLKQMQKDLKSFPHPEIGQDSLSHNVALFGSQIADFNNTVVDIKNQNAKLQDATKVLLQNVTSLKASMDKLSNFSQFSYPASKENDAQIQSMLSSINLLSANMSNINNTLSQKLQWIVDDESKDRKRIDTLSDSNQNVSARLTTVEGDYVKISSQEKLNSTIAELSNKVNTTDLHLLKLDSNILLLTTDYSNLSKNIQNVQAIIAQLKNNKPGSDQSTLVSSPSSSQVLLGPASQQDVLISTSQPLD